MKALLQLSLLGILGFVCFYGIAHAAEQQQIVNIKNGCWYTLAELKPDGENRNQIYKELIRLADTEHTKAADLKMRCRRISTRTALAYKEGPDVRCDRGNEIMARYYETKMAMTVTSTVIPFTTNVYHIHRTYVFAIPIR
jgi:hypothetical protein